MSYTSFTTAIIVSCILVYNYLVYPPLLSPLAKIPNAHWSSAFLPFWVLRKRHQGQELAAVVNAHQKLGPIVRLGPKDISISCYENGIRLAYGGGFPKPTYYDFFQYYGKPNTFCSLSGGVHASHRRRASNVYAKSSLFNSQELESMTRRILLGRLLPVLQANASARQPTEMLELSYCLCLDLISCFLFGLSSGSNFLENGHSLRPWLEHYENRYCKEAFWPQELPRLTLLLKTVGIDMLPKQNAESTQYLEDWMLRMCDSADATLRLAEKEGLQDAGDIPVVYQQLKKATTIEPKREQVDAETKRLEIASELFDHLSGAREVLGLVLAYTIYYISQSPSAQEDLRAEFLSVTPTMQAPTPFPSTSSTASEHEDTTSGLSQDIPLPSPASLDRLPYLSAVLKESLRMRPNSTPLPRITPDHPVTLAGIEGIPPGTRVNAFQWLVHRDPNTFAQPDLWNPDRWQRGEGKGSGGSEVGELWAFASGPLMRYIIALIYTNFKSRVIESEPIGRYLPGSLEDRVIVQFEHIKKSP
ncbi:MAG: hypothetical protein M1813_009283 [Trichoglossum hirsutum]|nr:MAG: hypothetical protein M1813_009283 [Trichoglossum hirsutum]